jgi:hypothetical protein
MGVVKIRGEKEREREREREKVDNVQRGVIEQT